MSITRLSLSGTPGRNYNFLAKDPAAAEGDGYIIGTLSMVPIVSGALSMTSAVAGELSMTVAVTGSLEMKPK